MKKLLTLLAVTVFVVLAWLMLSHNGGGSGKGPISANGPQPSPGTSAHHEGDSTPTSNASGLPTGKYPRWEGGRSTDLSDPRWEIIHEREKLDRGWQGKMPIDFFGKVIDLEGRAVEGAAINLIWTDLSPAGSSQLNTKSDVNGLFSLRNAQGKNLGVEVTKEGYYTAKQDRYRFEYAAFYEESFHQPDPNNPVIFRLRKKGQAEPLVHRQTLYGLKVDDTPQYLDLRSGKKTTGGDQRGDLVMRLSRSPTVGPNSFDWTLTLRAVGAGGLIESKEEFMFLAPEASYEQSISIQQKTGSPDYENQTRRNYYVRLADGRTYARISTDIRPRYNDGGAIDIELFLNPSGSRNLEFDPAKTIKP